MNVEASHAAAAAAAREAYGRLLAYLAYRWRDIAAAEDALSEAFASALATWPWRGVPTSPVAWLMAAAKRNLLHEYRHRLVTLDPSVTILIGESEAEVSRRPEAPLIPDDRLKLLFVCAHPAIDAGVRSALMLQTVLGVDATQIASAFLTSPSAMAQRLVRAKKKIAQTGIRFEEPDESELPERTHAVLEAIYAAYFLGSTAQAAGQTECSPDLREEAIYLADLTAALLPKSPEAAGLLAMLLLCESRQAARLNGAGEFVTLNLQNTHLWDKALIDRANQILHRASGARQPGPFQLEAAIQAAHCQRIYTQSVPWASIAQLYGQLLQLAPTTGARVGHAVALGEAERNPEAALGALALIAGAEGKSVADYQPFWAASAHYQAQSLKTPWADPLARAARLEAARATYSRAIGLTRDGPVKRHLQAQCDLLLEPAGR